MKQKMYNKSVCITKIIESSKKVHIKMINHSKKKNVYDKYLLKNVQDHARKS